MRSCSSDLVGNQVEMRDVEAGSTVVVSLRGRSIRKARLRRSSPSCPGVEVAGPP
jgi:hypothetical protein